MREVRVFVVSVLVMGLLAGMMAPAAIADTSIEASHELASPAGVLDLSQVGLDDEASKQLRGRLAQAKAEGRTEISEEFGDSGGSRVVYRYEPGGPKGGQSEVGPQWTVGLGWYAYIYLNRSDWLYLAGLGAAGATAALCWWLTPTLGGAIACAVAAYVVTHYILTRSAPPAGYCAEFKFTYAGTFAGYKVLKRNC